MVVDPGSLSAKGESKPIQNLLRWDKADVHAYYKDTGVSFSAILNTLDQVLALLEDCPGGNDKGHAIDLTEFVERIYYEIVYVLSSTAKLYVPERRKDFFKFWWNEELSSLKQASIDSNKLWKAAGKPRSGPLFTKRQSCRANYRKRLKDEQTAERLSYTNELHGALLTKNCKTRN